MFSNCTIVPTPSPGGRGTAWPAPVDCGGRFEPPGGNGAFEPLGAFAGGGGALEPGGSSGFAGKFPNGSSLFSSSEPASGGAPSGITSLRAATERGAPAHGAVFEVEAWEHVAAGFVAGGAAESWAAAMLPENESSTPAKAAMNAFISVS